MTTHAFSSLADQMARELQIPSARISVVSHPIGGTPDETLHDWADGAIDDLVRLLA